MQIEISRTNYQLLMSLIDKSATIIQQGNPTNRDYNVARRLRIVARQIQKQNDKE